ncbi:MAG: chorismate-binding protein [Planctomycetota bacterium]
MPRYFPDRETFHAIASHDARRPLRVPVYRQLLADKISPVRGYLALTQDDSVDNAFLLESVVGGERIGRYSFIGANPVETFTSDGSGDPLASLRSLLGDVAYAADADLPTLTGGIVGYAGYDLVRYHEPPHKLGGPVGGPADDRHLPDVHFGLYDRLIAFDNVDKTAKIIAHATITGDVDAAYDEACRAVDDLFDEVDRFAVGRASEEIDLRDLPTLAMEENRSRDDYEQAVARGVEYIHAGDIFQFVPSLRLRARSQAKPFDVYRALRVVNPSPYMFYLKTPACTLIGNSPEILCSVQSGKVTSRPLAGTRPRGKTPVEDEQLASELLGDAKEMSEHAMLVDLHRNDVGRVSRPDTVRVTERAVVERYSHVMHISSNVEGELREGLDAFDALRASLPVGTVSGAPKIRAMQIIDELDPTRRGPYGGAVGHADFGGDLDTCIALRTIVHHSGDCFDVQAGAGVVADSVPAKEYDECRNKAEAMLRAVAAADRGFASTLQDGA